MERLRSIKEHARKIKRRLKKENSELSRKDNLLQTLNTLFDQNLEVISEDINEQTHDPVEVAGLFIGERNNLEIKYVATRRGTTAHQPLDPTDIRSIDLQTPGDFFWGHLKPQAEIIHLYSNGKHTLEVILNQTTDTPETVTNPLPENVKQELSNDLIDLRLGRIII